MSQGSGVVFRADWPAQQAFNTGDGDMAVCRAGQAPIVEHGGNGTQAPVEQDRGNRAARAFGGRRERGQWQVP